MLYDYEYFKREILSLTTIDLNAYKEKQMKRRIDTLIAKHKITGYDKYVCALKNDKELFDEFVGYCKAAGRLCQPELMAGAFYMESEKAENSEDIQYLFHRISVCGILHSDEQQLRKMSDTQLLQLQTCYEELEELMNRNRENQSLAYYVLMDEYDSKESREVQMQTLAVIDEIDSVLDSSW